MSSEPKALMIIPAWMKLIVEMEHHSTLVACGKADLTASHCYRLKETFVKEGLMTTVKSGRNVLITFTPKGSLVLEACKVLKECSQDMESKW